MVVYVMKRPPNSNFCTLLWFCGWDCSCCCNCKANQISSTSYIVWSYDV